MLNEHYYLVYYKKPNLPVTTSSRAPPTDPFPLQFLPHLPEVSDGANPFELSTRHLFPLVQNLTDTKALMAATTARTQTTNNRELTNRRLWHVGAFGSSYSSSSSSSRNLNLRFAVKTTTFMRDRQFFYTIQTNKICYHGRKESAAVSREKFVF